MDAAESIGIKAFEGIELTGVRRLLVATGQWKDLSRFPEWIPPVDPDLVPFLANKGVRLLGLDLPSSTVSTAKNYLPTINCQAVEFIYSKGWSLMDWSLGCTIWLHCRWHWKQGTGARSGPW
ncbi:hypothetical protein [Peribacillus sp. YIM B13477]|uniref:hypothetical protein n=1 Tax=Peribacillus sp. YIM B13477 TaxID=3366300 RepID=UPI00366EDFB4